MCDNNRLISISVLPHPVLPSLVSRVYYARIPITSGLRHKLARARYCDCKYALANGAADHAASRRRENGRKKEKSKATKGPVCD